MLILQFFVLCLEDATNVVMPRRLGQNAFVMSIPTKGIKDVWEMTRPYGLIDKPYSSSVIAIPIAYVS
jgi:hypothetical protein